MLEQPKETYDDVRRDAIYEDALFQAYRTFSDDYADELLELSKEELLDDFVSILATYADNFPGSVDDRALFVLDEVASCWRKYRERYAEKRAQEALEWNGN